MLFIIIKKNDEIAFETLLQDQNQEVIAPLFEGEEYDVEVFNSDAEKVQTSRIVAEANGVRLKLGNLIPAASPIDFNTISQYISQLVTHGMDDELNQKLTAIHSMYPEIQYNVDVVRGGRLEQLFTLLFTELKKQQIIDDVSWQGHVDRYGIPFPAPGRSQHFLGNPDILVHVDNIIIIVELTLIGMTRRQWACEGESVPDHILGVKSANLNSETIGVFSAPDFYRPDHLRAVAAYPAHPVTLKLCKIDDFVSILRRASTRQTFVTTIRSLS
jgi:hypothetical protein